MSSSAPSVPLPRKDRRQNATSETTLTGSQPPIWTVTSPSSSEADGNDYGGGDGGGVNGNGVGGSVGGLETPLLAKCDRHSTRRDGVCCKELKGEDERSLVDPDVVRDV